MSVMNKHRSGIFFYVFYIAMLYVLLSWNNGEIAPPMYMRLAYLALLLIPVTFFKRYVFFYPIILTIFVSISKFMFSFSYMPTDPDIYCLLTFLWFIIVKSAGWIQLPNSNRQLSSFLLVCLLYISFVDLMDKASFSAISYCIFIVYLFLSSIKAKVSASSLLTSFSIVSLVLAASFILFRDQFALDYYSSNYVASGLERSSWTDPNYFGCLIGVGVVSAMIKMRNFGRMSSYEKIFYIAVCVLSLIAIVINASRGAVLAVGVSFVVNIIFTHSKARYKVMLSLGVVALLIILYTNDFFDLLFYRIENDYSGEGSGRVGIWETKMNSFLSSSNPLNMVFGYGNQGGVHLGYSYMRGFHNDFIAIIVEYGILGFLMMMYLFFRQISRAQKASGARSASIVILSFLFTVMMTLEPLTIGYLPYWLIVYLFIMVSLETQSLE